MLFELPPKRYKKQPAALIAGKRAIFLDIHGKRVPFSTRKVLRLAVAFKTEREATAYARKLERARLHQRELSALYRALKQSFLSASALLEQAYTIHRAAKRQKTKKAASDRAALLYTLRKDLNRLIASLPGQYKERRTEALAYNIFLIRYELTALITDIKKYIDSIKEGVWLSTAEVLDSLQEKYPDLDFDVRGSDFSGWLYNARGTYKKTIWSDRFVRANMKVRSIYLYVIFRVEVVNGVSGSRTVPTGADRDEDEDEDSEIKYVFACQHLGWNTTPVHVMTELAEPGEAELVDGKRVALTKLDNLINKVFKPANFDIVEFVGLQFSKGLPPRPEDRPSNTSSNPRKKRKK